MPTHKYAYGHEIREHAERTVRHWKLGDSAVFRTRILDASWDDDRGRWAVKMETDRGPGCAVSLIYVRHCRSCTQHAYRYILLTSGNTISHPPSSHIPSSSTFVVGL